MKRLFDFFFSLTGLIILLPLFATAAVFIKLDGKGPVFFRQERIGKNFMPFKIYKFRTMIVGAEDKGSLITVSGDSRITRIGRFLRKTKFDELPQLINVLKGDMSLVGPRPEVKKYVELFRSDYEKLLSMRPGITDPASIEFSDEESILAQTPDWERVYTGKILPEKIKLTLYYIDNHNVIMDMKLIFKTILKI